MKEPTYFELFKRPEWQRKRLEILERDLWCCQICFSTTAELHVHHAYYIAKRKPWDYPDEALRTLCKNCHDSVTQVGKTHPPFWEQLLIKLHFNSDIIASLVRSFEAANKHGMTSLGFGELLLSVTASPEGMAALENIVLPGLNPKPAKPT